MIFNVTGGGTGCTLTITAPVGATVTVSKDGKSKPSKVATTGTVVFKGLETGTWTITITKTDEKPASKTILITADYSDTINFDVLPKFTYTGDYEIVNDDNEAIETSSGNWKIRFLTSGTLVFSVLNGAENGIDVFLVGGGGGGGKSQKQSVGSGGGGGGYTNTQKNTAITAGTSYGIVIGAGGASAVAGGNTSAFGAAANGGAAGNGANGGAGGSGGGGGGYSKDYAGANGGSDGSTPDKVTSGGTGGAGQSATTREFGDTNGKLYAGGGGGGSGISGGGTASEAGAGGANGGGAGGVKDVGADGEANTGGGGGGGGQKTASGKTAENGGSGGSGIVVIRNAREVS